MRLTLLAALIASSLSAQAQVSDEPPFVGGSLSWTQLRNLYRVSADQNPQDDQLLAIGVQGGAQLKLGRQRLKLEGRAAQNNYSGNSELRHLGYSAAATLDWTVGSQFSGLARLSSQQQIAAFNPGNAPSTRAKNLERFDQARFEARYGLPGLWALEGAYSANKRSYSLALYDAQRTNQHGPELALRWQPGTTLTLRIGVRQSDVTVPRARTLADGSFEQERSSRRDLDTLVVWNPDPRHSVLARLSHSRTEYDNLAARTNSGTNGRVDWTWSPTTTLRFQTSLSRDLGVDQRGESIDPSLSTLTNNRRTDTFAVSASYALTAKVSLEAGGRDARRTFDDVVAGLGASGRDRTRSANIGARWRFDRNGQLGCQITGDHRGGTTLYSAPFTAYSAGCTVQYRLS